MRLHSTETVVLNALTVGVWIAALFDVLRSPRRDWYNPRGKLFTLLLVCGPSLFYRGVFIPLGPMTWFGWWRNAGGLGHLPRRDRQASA